MVIDELQDLITVPGPRAAVTWPSDAEVIDVPAADRHSRLIDATIISPPPLLTTILAYTLMPGGSRPPPPPAPLTLRHRASCSRIRSDGLHHRSRRGRASTRDSIWASSPKGFKVPGRALAVAFRSSP